MAAETFQNRNSEEDRGVRDEGLQQHLRHFVLKLNEYCTTVKKKDGITIRSSDLAKIISSKSCKWKKKERQTEEKIDNISDPTFGTTVRRKNPSYMLKCSL